MAIGEDTVVIDANHPLAGETLTCAIVVLAIREATAEELTHGHPRGRGTSTVNAMAAAWGDRHLPLRCSRNGTQLWETIELIPTLNLSEFADG
jgi:hypothetical protein